MGTPSISSIPLGFEPVKSPLTLDDTTLTSLPSRKLYCNGLVLVAADTDAQVLDAALDGLRATRLLIAPADLKGVLAPKCNLLETKSHFL